MKYAKSPLKRKSTSNEVLFGDPPEIRRLVQRTAVIAREQRGFAKASVSPDMSGVAPQSGGAYEIREISVEKKKHF